MLVELYSDTDLVKGCQKSQRQYQELLYRRFAQKMYGICLSYAGEREFAQDILQDAFIKVFNSIDLFKGDGSLEGWIRRIVVHSAIDHLRKRESLKKLVIDSEYEKITISTNDALPKIQFNELLSFISKLPEGARSVFNLFAVEGYSHKEIAELLQISEGTSKSQYNRARNLLKNWLGNIDKG
jgi:RNA polymerase sigma factor (sigma-70 family)